MKKKLLQHLVCPEDKSQLQLKNENDSHEEIIQGELTCEQCHKSYPIIDGIPRFVESGHYTGSFGFQWNHYRSTQLDSQTGLNISSDRFNQVVAWGDNQGLWGLEAGCGAGRFTEVAAKTGVELVSIDASSAIEANQKNNSDKGNIHFIQADLNKIPFVDGFFDKAYCLGVIQHTEKPEKSFQHLVKMVKSNGGELAFDCYAKTWDTFLWSKYWFRPFLKRLPEEKLLKWVDRWVPFLIRVHDVMRWIPLAGRYLAHRLVPVCNYKYSFPLSKEQNLQWAKLDTFDMFSPEHDHPQSLQDIENWMKPLNLAHVKLEYGPNGIIGRLKRAK